MILFCAMIRVKPLKAKGRLSGLELSGVDNQQADKVSDAESSLQTGNSSRYVDSLNSGYHRFGRLVLLCGLRVSGRYSVRTTSLKTTQCLTKLLVRRTRKTLVRSQVSPIRQSDPTIKQRLTNVYAVPEEM